MRQGSLYYHTNQHNNMANDTIEKSVPMVGGGANAALPSNPVPVVWLLQSSGYFETKE
jgi:hypothetical protein